MEALKLYTIKCPKCHRVLAIKRFSPQVMQSGMCPCGKCGINVYWRVAHGQLSWYIG